MDILAREGLKAILGRHADYLSEFLNNNPKVLDTFQQKEFRDMIEENRNIINSI